MSICEADKENKVVAHALRFKYGGMVEPELRYLYRACEGKLVAELGSYIGMSSFVIANSADHLVCIDRWEDDWSYIEPNQRKVYEALRENVPCILHEFLNNIMPVTDKISVLRADTAKAAEHFNDNSVDVLLIDADHSYEGVSKDLALWLPKLAKGGTVLMHNYESSWPGVKAAAKEAPLNHITTVSSLGVFTRKENIQWT